MEPAACGLATVQRLEADVGTGIAIEQGSMRLPPGPGLGVELDREALERYSVDR
jgi:L-alanine-DL-glutamate epimerase-like enolase superfamily enzyme